MSKLVDTIRINSAAVRSFQALQRVNYGGEIDELCPRRCALMITGATCVIWMVVFALFAVKARLLMPGGFVVRDLEVATSAPVKTAQKNSSAIEVRERVSENLAEPLAVAGRIELVAENDSAAAAEIRDIGSILIDLGYEKADTLASLIVSYSRRGGLDPFLAAALMRVQSTAPGVEREGRAALFQIDVQRGPEIARGSGLVWAPERIQEPAYNIALGVGYLLHLKRDFGDLNSSLAAFLWEPDAVRTMRAGKKPLPRGINERVQSVIDTYSAWTGRLLEDLKI